MNIFEYEKMPYNHRITYFKERIDPEGVLTGEEDLETLYNAIESAHGTVEFLTMDSLSEYLNSIKKGGK